MPDNTAVKLRDRILNIAHRGARAFAPENTLEAFAKAHTIGCDMIELDVHLSADNEIIVHHDDNLLRCTDVKDKFPDRPSYFISDFYFEELNQLDAGSWFARELALPAESRQGFLQSLTPEEFARYISPQDLARYASGTINVPTLGQTLELSRNLGLWVNIELKMLPRMYPGLTDAVLDLVDEMGLQTDVLISSFDHEQLRRVRQRSPAVQTAVLTNERLALPGEYLQRIGADAFHPGTEPLGLHSLTRTLDAGAVSAVRKLDKRVNVWTCNDKDEMRQLIAAGVTGLISDYPNRVREVLDELGAMID
ncbi:glycerophosphodiester phosphodiesterase family protein [Methylomicrobium sp. Wu6]|uniref:glycerophosphodiester phosphodiesterase n=1 Tax=Methylomicrobium sp. Wu6 TaxID=3107928 RepID=UPI002DD62D19|nr:glycerophosphodiester phosphodiesterase family protein [Methylomicrobium sp. Wu6]MEC4749484.1 glycerophosphodiester phosphodiesterase family protein [Methylomicrobium sp. Wu6]